MCSFIATVGASEIGNIFNLEDIKPKAGDTLAISKIMDAITSDKLYFVEIELDTDTKLDKYGITLLKDQGLDVFLKKLFPNGVAGARTYNVAIDAKQVAKMPESFDFGTAIMKTDEDGKIIVGNTIIDYVIAEGSYIIMPVAKGDFGFEYDLEFNAGSKDYKYLYYISDKGDVTDATKSLTNQNGTITFSMSHASAYVLTAEKLPGDIAADIRPADPSTGSSSGGSSAGGSSSDDNTGETGDTPDDNTGEGGDTPDVAEPDEFESNGVTATANDGVLPDGAVFSVEPISSDDNSRFSYEINFTVNGEKVQPNGNVTVKIPVPAALDGNPTIYVYRVSDGRYKRLASDIVDGYVVFKTNHFSEYILSATRISNPPSNLDGDDDYTYTDNSADTSTDNNNSGTTANPDTGAEGIMLTLGLFTLAGAAAVMSRKRR